jgi:hypothetical protein
MCYAQKNASQRQWTAGKEDASAKTTNALARWAKAQLFRRLKAQSVHKIKIKKQNETSIYIKGKKTLYHHQKNF